MVLCFPVVLFFKFQGITQFIAVIAFVAILFLALSIFCTKKGIVKDNQGIHIGYFSWNKLVYQDPIELLNLPVISLLKFRRKSRGAYTSFANPEFSVSFNTFEIYALNDKHTVKRKIISLTNEDKANATLDFLKTNSKLRHEVYSPKFS